MITTGVIFDAFGTLLKIQAGKNPYRQLIKIGIEHGRRPQPSDVLVLMQQPCTLSEAAEILGINANSSQLKKLEGELTAEIDRIEPYPDGIEAVNILREHGLKVAICSNLAMPYTAAVLRHYPTMDAYTLSCMVGMMKPDPRIYQMACRELQAEPFQVTMIGDSRSCDCEGPLAAGIRGLYLDRLTGSGDHANLLCFAHALLR